MPSTAFHIRRLKTAGNYANYKAKRNEVEAKIRAAQMSYKQSLLNKFQSNPKAMKVNPCIGPLQKCDGSVKTSEFEIAENLNRYFESTFTKKHLHI